jgi:hypothetical protein
MMVYSLAVAAGGALGAVSRYWLMLWVSAQGGMRFPWGTLLVNVLGSCAIGVLYVLISERIVLTEQWRALLVVGYLGALHHVFHVLAGCLVAAAGGTCAACPGVCGNQRAAVSRRRVAGHDADAGTVNAPILMTTKQET